MFKGEISSILCVPLRQGLIQTEKVLFELATTLVERHTRPHAQSSEHFSIRFAQ